MVDSTHDIENGVEHTPPQPEQLAGKDFTVWLQSNVGEIDLSPYFDKNVYKHKDSRVKKNVQDDKNNAPEEEESDDGHDIPARLNKRRRTAMSGAIIASRVLRHVRDLEATVKRLEDVYNTEMERVETIISQLMKDMESLTGDSEREASL